MGGDCSQKLCPGGESQSTPGRSRTSDQYETTTLSQRADACGLVSPVAPGGTLRWLPWSRRCARLGGHAATAAVYSFPIALGLLQRNSSPGHDGLWRAIAPAPCFLWFLMLDLAAVFRREGFFPSQFFVPPGGQHRFL